MESAPQSTITHNAVIEFASDPDSRRRRTPRKRRAHKKKACPAQKGGLKSAGPCQNRLPGATPRKPKPSILEGNSGKSSFPWRGIRVFFGNGRESADRARSPIAAKRKNPPNPRGLSGQ